LRRGLWPALLVAAAGACGNDALGVGAGGGHEPAGRDAVSGEARRVIETLRARKKAAPTRPAHPREEPRDVLPPAVATRIDRAGGRLVPRLAEPGPHST